MANTNAGATSRPPPGPPPGPPLGPPMGPSPGPPNPSRRNWIVAVALIAILALIGGAIALSSGSSHKKATGGTGGTGSGGGEIFLQAASATGPDPFAPSAANKAPTSTIPASTPVTLGPASANAPAPTAPVFVPAPLAPQGSTATITALSGGAPGLYGGTLNQSSCNKQQMIDFLASNADKAQAWADVEGIAVADIGSYINGLTSVQLRSDTRVTNHGFVNGHATEHQDILQAGTAVMVDQYGIPRARCACGNPLLPPRAVTTTPTYQGTPWTGFNPANVTVIDASKTVIKVITIINITNGTLIGRPTGPKPGPDRRLPGAPTPTSTPTATTLPLVTVPGETLPPLTTLPPFTPPPVTLPPVTSPPATAPPTTAPPADFVLASANYTVSELAANWTVDKNAGTATIAIPGNTATYTWTVPPRIKPSGTNIQWGGSAQGNIHLDIAVNGSGIAFDTADLAVSANGSGQKSAVIRPTAAQEVQLIYSMGFSVTVTYTYRR